MDWFQRLPNWDRQEYLPITVDDFRVSIRSAKKWTMRGSDSFTPMELSLLPDAFIQVLLDIYRVIEKTGTWPLQLLKSFVVFLPKEEGDIGWKGIRPITVAPLIMRLFSRIRARQLIARRPPCPVKYVGLHIPTIAQLHCDYDRRTTTGAPSTRAPFSNKNVDPKLARQYLTPSLQTPVRGSRPTLLH